MINCLIVDDEPLAQNILEGYITADERLYLIKKCSTASAAFELLQCEQVDLMFLDIKMPGLDGITFLRALKESPSVIFTTAFSEYAALSYDLEAVDYLLKPITKDRFEKSLNKFFKMQPPVTEYEKDYTYFKVSGKLVKVAHDEILYAQSIKDYIMLYTKNGNLIVHMTMKYLSGLLPSKKFIRIHRSFFVNCFHLTEVSNNQVKINAEVIPVGESYRQNLLQIKAIIS